MRIRIGAAMPLKGGRPAVVVAELKEETLPDGRIIIHTDIGYIDRVTPFSVEAVAGATLGLVQSMIEHRPCVVTDTGSAQGLALYQQLKRILPDEVHRPHSFPGTGKRDMLFSSFLQQYSDDRILWKPGLEYRADIDRALVFFGGVGKSTDGVELSSEDNALVMAVGLAMQYPRHGGIARIRKGVTGRE